MARTINLDESMTSAYTSKVSPLLHTQEVPGFESLRAHHNQQLRSETGGPDPLSIPPFFGQTRPKCDQNVTKGPDDSIFSRLRLLRCSRSNGAASEMLKRHYLGKWPKVVVLTLLLVDSSVPVGVCVFALPPRETSKRYGCTAWELARLWVDDSMPKNTETWFISRAVKFIQKNFREVGVIVSYADPSKGHRGTIYRAGSWIEDGKTDQDRKTPRFDYEANGRVYSRRKHVPPGAHITRKPRVSKHRFIYWTSGHEKRRAEVRRA